MAEQMNAPASPPSFEYELFEGDPDHLRTVVASPPPSKPWIDPVSLKLKHRIGRGTFGDVWLATHHQTAPEFDQFHEVALKMLHSMREDHTQTFLKKFEEIFVKCRRLQGVCWLHGITIISGKICIAMKFYEGSIDDRMAQLKGSKLPLPDVLRLGIELVKGVMQLHTIGVLVLNLKPSNFLVNERGQAILGDFGIPYLLRGASFPDPEIALRLGTPNYMAPEQWEPEVRGPLSFETDAWGFGCSVVEMLTGALPWSGKSVREIYHSVVIKQEKSQIPSGLPPMVENVLSGCFEYDLRNRPLMTDILHAFESSQDALRNEGGWVGLSSRTLGDRSNDSGHSVWFLAKDHLQLNDTVRSRKPLRSCNPQNMNVPSGTVVGVESDTDRDGFVLVKIHGMHNPQRVHTSTLERVSNGLAVGDWVRLKSENSIHSPVGVVHSVEREGGVMVGFLGLDTPWRGKFTDLQMAASYCAGDFVRLKASVMSPRFEWPHKIGGEWATGRISQVLPNGCLVVSFPGRLVLGDEPKSFLTDPAEVEKITFDSCRGIVKKYQHVEDYHWAVRPLVIAVGLFTVMKLGFFLGKNMTVKLQKGKKHLKQCEDHQHHQKHLRQWEDHHHLDAQGGGNPAWLPPPVANIIFREGGSAAAPR
ncbi:Serine-threonine/tyrosine-protein kinase, catalytic domain [Dillenia turbinata]|uniref:Serine-threonine/tyrosine-protein kinase, catalytic domain n=1 Tax=Dillenia turbinata TaxID=194707 RepID=A0AAN8UBB0_9MAGN